MSVSPSGSPASRQDLVVPPRQSNLSAIIGSLVCAAVGFGLVWALGIGRAPRPEDLGEEPAVVMATEDAAPDRQPEHQPAPDTSASVDRDFDEPDMLPLVDDAIPVTAAARNTRWHSPATEESGDLDDHDPENHPTQLASLDLPDAVVPTAGESDDAAGRFSRFSSPDLPPFESAGDAQPIDPAAAAADLAAAPSQPVLPPRDEPPSNGPPTVSDAPLPEDPGDLAAPAPEPPAPAATAFGAAPPAFPQQAAAPMPPAPPPTQPMPPSPFAGAPGSAAQTTAAAVAAEPPVAAPPPPGAFGLPFASAPPMVARDLADADPEPMPPTAPRPEALKATGLGRPGPMQLEGVQTPQISVEKRGPREISVGKAARYEIVVRNIGSATAHEVVLRDAVPQGTALVTTTPPASPVSHASGEADGALVWTLGTLPPGGQAVVTMEVMPQVEGEIGSVASVSFRADASVRSRSTRPDLRIECTPPAPVLIGRDLQVTVTVTNPGTGVATGVVLEGFLPDNVSHRSGPELEFDVGQLRPGESRTIDLVLGTRGPGVHAARLAARADGGIEIAHQVPIEVTAPTLELAIDMPLRRFLQRPATCAIAMVNAGTAPAQAIELAAQLPPGMKFVKANNAGWHDDRTHRVLWNLEELPPGDAGTVEVVVMPVELGPQKIVAAARSADGLAAQVAHTCDVEGLAALSFEVVDSEDPIEIEGLTEYVVRVGNQGTKPATGVRVVATLLGDLEPLEAQGPGGHRFENLTVTFEPLAKLAPAEEAVFRIRARGRRAGDQRIQVQLTSADQPAPITKEEITRVYADR
jgi:uncharacterized repeat protein (TIGR01451 family)